MTTGEPKGEFIEDWEVTEEDCQVDDCTGTLHTRRWRRYSDGQERVLVKCFTCDDSVWTDG